MQDNVADFQRLNAIKSHHFRCLHHVKCQFPMGSSCFIPYLWPDSCLQKKILRWAVPGKQRPSHLAPPPALQLPRLVIPNNGRWDGVVLVGDLFFVFALESRLVTDRRSGSSGVRDLYQNPGQTGSERAPGILRKNGLDLPHLRYSATEGNCQEPEAFQIIWRHQSTSSKASPIMKLSDLSPM